ncbi:VanZ family protein [Marinicella sediminis]|uniref:VanZ family protein n=1 Tax=Marinicella sediminis TaxID=1792834 RepID=A0ABV7JE05_9GAMM|nr:VanZ family protein [Marinicella sediminis]
MAELTQAPRWAMVSGWMMLGGLVVLSLVSLPAVNTGVPDTDKWLHLLSYGWLGFWFYHLYPRHLLKVLTGLVLLGLSLEALQALNPARSTEWLDALMNACGVGLAWVVYQVFGWRWFFIRPVQSDQGGG